MIELSTLLDLISDRQLQEYVAWLEAHPDSNEEESIAYLMDILNNSQVDILLEKDFKILQARIYIIKALLKKGSKMGLDLNTEND